MVTNLQSCQRCGRTGNQGFDIGAQIAERRNKEWGARRQPSGEDQVGQNKVEPWACCDNKDFSPKPLVRKRSPAIVWRGGFRLILTEQLDVSAERDSGDDILRFTYL